MFGKNKNPIQMDNDGNNFDLSDLEDNKASEEYNEINEEYKETKEDINYNNVNKKSNNNSNNDINNNNKYKPIAVIIFIFVFLGPVIMIIISATLFILNFGSYSNEMTGNIVDIENMPVLNYGENIITEDFSIVLEKYEYNMSNGEIYISFRIDKDVINDIGVSIYDPFNTIELKGYEYEVQGEYLNIYTKKNNTLVSYIIFEYEGEEYRINLSSPDVVVED